MVSLENANSGRIVQTYRLSRFERMGSLVVCIPDPGKRTQDRDGDRDVCEYAHSQHRVVVVAVVDKDQNHFEY